MSTYDGAQGGHSRIQKEKVKQFCSVTGASDDDAKVRVVVSNTRSEESSSAR